MLEQRGLKTPIVAIDGEDGHQSEPVYPTIEQLPESIRQRLEAIVESKALR